MGYTSSIIRDKINKTAKKLIGTGRLQKKISVFYYNIKSLFDFSHDASNELFDYGKIINGRKSFYNSEYYRSNNSYGIASILREYSGFGHPINACIEHGLYWGDFYFKHEVLRSGLKGVLTFGEKRIRVLEKVSDVPIKAIGPYIIYANKLMDDIELNRIKKENGKTLLVIPTHSAERVKMVYDQESLIESIKQIAKDHNFKTIIVCLYYKDLLNKMQRIYEDNGFIVVTAGYEMDPIFLKRLRTFIELSDYTISNDVGTHIGYCIALGKPHLLISQRVEYKPDASVDLENIITTNDVVEDKRIFRKIFEEWTDQIQQEQIEIVKKYWGTDYVRSADEMRELLESFR